MWDAVLVNCDGTLADTRPLEWLRDDARKTRNWSPYCRRVGESDPVRTIAGEPMVDLFPILRDRGIPHAIVTNSRDEAVNAWFRAQRLEQPLTVASAAKPGTSGLTKALQLLGLGDGKPTLLLIDDGFDGAQAARGAGMYCATPAPTSNLNGLPNFLLPELAAVIDTGLMVRLAGEHELKGTLGYLLGERANGPVLVAGVYRKGSNHHLTQSLLVAKDGDWSEWLINLTIGAVNALVREAGLPPDTIITAVPPRLEQPDRFGRLLTHVAGATGLKAEPELLRFVRKTSRQRWVRGSERETNVHDAIAAGRPLGGRAVIVLDDITTLGATLDEAARAVTAAGGSAHLIALAKTAYDEPGPSARWIYEADPPAAARYSSPSR